MKVRKTSKAAKPPAPAKTLPAPAPAKAVVAAPAKTLVPPSAVAKPKREPRPVPIKIPALLLEPDHLPGEEPVLSGPGARFVASAQAAPPVAAPANELPESYGTEQIFLAARDPYSVFVSWDLSGAQQRRYNSESASGALTVRLRRENAEGPIHLEVHMQAESKDWFIHCGAPDTMFVAELGLHEKNSGAWRRVSVSKPAVTPRDRVVLAPAPTPEPAPVRVEAPAPPVPSPLAARAEIPWAPTPAVVFATPRHVPVYFEEQEQRATELPTILGGNESRWEGPRWTPVEPPAWTPAQSKALDELISIELLRSQQGSIDIEELLRRRIGLAEEDAPGSAGEAPSSFALQLTPEQLLGLAQPGGPSSVEAAGAAPARKGFWFRVNAELIIYGSTEPSAHVSIGGRPIRLREDGSFSYRFALPDGAYELPVIALSRDGDDGRAADLRFMRQTQYSGEVEAHPQDRGLKTPTTANL